MVAATVASIAALSLTAAPALAHYCFKSFNTSSNVGNSNAWITADEWLGFLEFIEQDLIAEGCAEPDLSPIQEVLEDAPAGTYFMGPGLLAGGAVHQGKAPKKIGHLPFHEVIDACFGEGAA